MIISEAFLTDTALDKVPGPWETVIQGAVTGYVRLGATDIYTYILNC